MEHFYQNIEGWFSYEYVYKDIIQQVDDDSLFVEIGSYKGKSAAFMAVEIANSGKKIRFECIDPMELMGAYLNMPQNEKDGYSAEEFHQRLESVKDYYKLHQMTSDKAVNLYDDESIDFLLIDGDHSYEGVKKDIINYLPKMRPGGLIVGDDAYDPEIQRALQDAAGHLTPVNNGIHFFINIPSHRPNTLYIDSTNCKTDLCLLGSKFNTDKAPYSLDSVCSKARKGYTAVYELFFSSMRYKKINFCEIGIEAGASAQMWENYFSRANLYAFEYDENKIELCKKLAPKTTFLKTDVSDEEILNQTFKNTGKLFDIIIDDSNHHQPDQLKIIKVSVNYLKPGGILIIEDIYREYTEDIFDSVLGDEWAFKTFIICDHKNRSGHDNDKIWVGIKK